MEPSPTDLRIASIHDRLKGRRPATFEAWVPILLRLQLQMGAGWFGMNEHSDLLEVGHETANRVVERACRKSVQAFIVAMTDDDDL